MARVKTWIKRGLMVVGLAVVGTAAVAAVKYRQLHQTPDWYEPDTSTEAEHRTAAGEAEAKLVRFYDWVAGRKAAEDQLHQAVADTSAANAKSAAAAQKLLDSPEAKTQQVEFTEAQLNGIFHTWADYKDRRAMLEQYVENPRLVIRDNQLIVVGKAKQVDAVVSLIFEPSITPDGKLDLRLKHVMGGMWPLPEAFWGPHRESVRQGLLNKLPGFQEAAALTPDGLANGPAASAAMNELLVAALADHDQPTPAVVFVPVRPPALAPTMPVRITAVAAHAHTLTLTAEPMTVAERKDLVEQIKSADAAGGTPAGGDAAK